MHHVSKEKLLNNAKVISGDIDRGEPAHSNHSVSFDRNLSAATLTDRDDILALRDEWLSLESASPNTVLFQSFDWCRNHIEFAGQDINFRPFVFVIRRDDRVIGVLPLCLQQKGRMKVLTGFSEPFQQYTEILLPERLVDDNELSDVWKVLVRQLRGVGADYFHFGQVRETGRLAKLLDGRVSKSGERDAAPYVSMGEFGDFKTYLKTLNSKTRKNLRNARNRIERDGRISHNIARSGPLMAQIVERVYEGREAWLERMGITSRAFMNTEFEAFLKRFTGDHVTGVETIAMSLTHGDNPISDQWGFVYRGRYYAFMANWNTEYEAVSPGRLHLGQVIKTCFDEGIETADFMIPAADYKMSWTKQAEPVCDYVLPLNFKGILYNRLWLDFARPLSKKIFFALPPALRGRLLKSVLGGGE